MYKKYILFLMLIANTPLHGNLNEKYIITNERLISLIKNCYHDALVYQILGSGQLKIFSKNHKRLDIRKVAKKIFKKQQARYLKTSDPSNRSVDSFIRFLVHDDTEPQYLILLQKYEALLTENSEAHIARIIHRDLDTKENTSNVVKALEQSLLTYMENSLVNNQSLLQPEFNIFIQTTDETIILTVNAYWNTAVDFYSKLSGGI